MESEVKFTLPEQKQRTISEAIDEAGAYMMAIGMPHDAFWHGDYREIADYENAYEFTRLLKNEEMHRQGLYIYAALQSALSQALWNGKGQRPKPYMEYPIPVTDIEREAEKQRKIAHTLEWVRKGQIDAGRIR